MQVFIKTRKRHTTVRANAFIYLLRFAGWWGHLFRHHKSIRDFMKYPFRLATKISPYTSCGYFCDMNILMKYFHIHEYKRHVRVNISDIAIFSGILKKNIEENKITIQQDEDIHKITINDVKELDKCFDDLLDNHMYDIIEFNVYQ